MLFQFLDKPSASDDPIDGLNATLSGYFVKVVQIIISCEPKEIMNYFKQNDYQVLDKMAAHLDNKSICELFVKVINEILKSASKNPNLA